MHGNSCPHCGSHLQPYWWETQLPQFRWSKEQAAATAQRQEAAKQWAELLRAAHNTPSD